MTLTERGFWFVSALLSLVIGVTGAAIALVAVELRPKVYASSAVLQLDQPLLLSQSRNTAGYDKLVALRQKYVAIATTYAFAEGAVAGSGVSPTSLHDAVVAQASGTSLDFNVGAVSKNRMDAYIYARLLSTGIVEYVTGQERALGLPMQKLITIHVLTPATTAIQISPTRNREIGTAAFVGVLLFGLSLSLQNLRRT